MDNLNDVLIFIRVVENKSFTKAAGMLGLSPSFVSKRVKALEGELDTQLLNRSTRFISLTEAGEMFYERSAKIVGLLEAAKIEAHDQTAKMKGTLRVVSGLGFAEYVLWALIADFVKIYPDICVSFEAVNRSTNLLRSAVDVAIRSADLVDTSLEHQTLGTLRYHICASPDYLASEGRPESPRDLKRFNCLIHTAHGGPDRWTFTGRPGDYSVRVAGNYWSNSGVAILGACERGVGIARLPDYVVGDGVAGGRLEELFPGQLKFERTLKAFYPRSEHIPLKTATFVSFLKEHLESRLAIKNAS